MPSNSKQSKELITFKWVYDNLRRKEGMKERLGDLKLLFELTGLFLGNPDGNAIEAVIDVLAEKKGVIDATERVLEVVKNLEEPVYKDRVEKMRFAYGLLYYTAFFDALDGNMPDNIRKKLKPLPNEQRNLSRSAVGSAGVVPKEQCGIVFPNICFDLNEVDKYLIELYEAMASGYTEFVKGLAFEEEASEKDYILFREAANGLPKKALDTFHDQYLTLCKDFNEFYIYTSIEWKTELVATLDNRYNSLISTAMCNRNSIEAGMSELRRIVQNVPHQIKHEEVMQVADAMRNHYQKDVTNPLIDSDKDVDSLEFPRIDEAFIPQAYKLLKYNNGQLIGIKKAWADKEICQDMAAFWARYLVDMDSIDSLLLILGEPGSGKSLLTRVISARLSSKSSVIVRIPLREHDVEKSIESIVCERLNIDGDTAENITRFKWFTDEFPSDAITLIFDGYDEVQQATGMVYRQFLNRLKEFQNNCRENNRPVRIVVTSRETLIDKAEIPKGTTIMKLLEFDNARKKSFIHIWNEYNHDILAEGGLNDFALPDGNDDLKSLSSQPLLLTMLAIYDADFDNRRNALASDKEKGEKLDRTNLYDKLLRRFIRRELKKGKRKYDNSFFEELDHSDQDGMVNNEMKKLGVAALGMFIREKLSIRIEELDADFIKTEIVKSIPRSQDSTALRNAETFLGSFFFIHNPRLKTFGEDEKDASFEFLHKTFYEFLVADIVLDSLLDAVDYLIEIMKPKKRGKEQYANALENPNDLNPFYFPVLSGACLCTEPEIIKMAVEWKETKIERIFGKDDPEITNSLISTTLNDIFDSHLDFIKKGTFKKLEVIEERNLLSERPYPQSCAIYLLNILITRVLIDGRCKVESNKWSYISQYVKMNLPLPIKDENNEVGKGFNKLKFQIDPIEEVLLSFMSLFTVETNEGNVVFTFREQSLDMGQIDLLEARIKIFDFMQDDISGKLYALHSLKVTQDSKQEIRRELAQKGMDEKIEIAMFDLKRRVKNIAYFVTGNRASTELCTCFELSREICLHRATKYIYQNEVITCLDELVSITQDFPMNILKISVNAIDLIWAHWWEIFCNIFRHSINDYHYQIIIGITNYVVDLLRNTQEGDEILFHQFRTNELFIQENAWPLLELLIILYDRGLFDDPEYDDRIARLVHEINHKINYKHLDSIKYCYSDTHFAWVLLKTLKIYNYYDLKYGLFVECEFMLPSICREISVNDSKLPELMHIGITINNTNWIRTYLKQVADDQKYLFRQCTTQQIFELLRIATEVEEHTFIKVANSILLERNIHLNPKIAILYITYMIESGDSDKLMIGSIRGIDIITFAFERFNLIVRESLNTSIELLL